MAFRALDDGDNRMTLLPNKKVRKASKWRTEQRDMLLNCCLELSIYHLFSSFRLLINENITPYTIFNSQTDKSHGLIKTLLLFLIAFLFYHHLPIKMIRQQSLVSRIWRNNVSFFFFYVKEKWIYACIQFFFAVLGFHFCQLFYFFMCKNENFN